MKSIVIKIVVGVRDDIRPELANDLKNFENKEITNIVRDIEADLRDIVDDYRGYVVYSYGLYDDCDDKV